MKIGKNGRKCQYIPPLRCDGVEAAKCHTDGDDSKMCYLFVRRLVKGILEVIIIDNIIIMI